MQGQAAAAGVGQRRVGARIRSALKVFGRFLLALALTYLGLLAVTFFIGRVIPVDPALAIANRFGKLAKA